MSNYGSRNSIVSRTTSTSSRRAQQRLNDTHKAWLKREALRMQATKAGSVDYSRLTERLNTRFSTSFSQFQVAASLGRQGINKTA